MRKVCPQFLYHSWSPHAIVEAEQVSPPIAILLCTMDYPLWIRGTYCTPLRLSISEVSIVLDQLACVKRQCVNTAQQCIKAAQQSLDENSKTVYKTAQQWIGTAQQCIETQYT